MLAVAALMSSIVWPIGTHRAVRVGLGRFFRELGIYARALAELTAAGKTEGDPSWVGAARVHRRALRAALEGRIFVAPSLGADLVARHQTNPGRRTDPFAALTPRQREVLQLLADGKSVKQVASSLSISTRTVEFHKYTMMETVGAKGMADLVRIAIRYGLVSE